MRNWAVVSSLSTDWLCIADLRRFQMVLRGWIDLLPSFNTGTTQADKVCVDEWSCTSHIKGQRHELQKMVHHKSYQCHRDTSSGPAPRIKLDAVLGLCHPSLWCIVLPSLRYIREHLCVLGLLYIFAVGIAASVLHQVGLVVYLRRSEGSCDAKRALPVGAVPATLPSMKLDEPKMQPCVFQVEVATPTLVS